MRAQDTAAVGAPGARDSAAIIDSSDPAISQTPAAPDSATIRAQQMQQEAEALADTLAALWVEIDSLFRRFAIAEGEERLILDGLVERRVAIIRPALGELTGLVVRMDSAGVDGSAPRAVALTMLDNARGLVRDAVIGIGQRVVAGRADRSSVEVSDLLALERDITQASAEYDDYLRALLNIADYKNALGVDVQDDYDYVDPRIVNRSDRLMSEITVTTRSVRDLTDRLNSADDEAEARLMRLELSAAQERRNAGTASLVTVIDLMDRREMPTVEQKRLLIQTTGRVTTDVLDVNVATGLLRQGWVSAKQWFSEQTPQFLFNLLMFVLIVLAFRVLARITRRLAARALDRTKVPKLLRHLGVSMMANSVLLLGILIGLSQMGIHVGPILAGLGVAGFIVGFALQDSLSNFASGMMILIYHPFDVGDVIEAAGVSGRVDHLSLVSTTILTFANERLTVPNRQVWGNVIHNKTAESKRRVDLTFEVGRRSDVPRAEALFQEILSAHPLVLNDPAPAIVVDRIGESAIRFRVRPWVNTADYWDVYWGVTRTVNDRFEAEGIARPFPKREVVGMAAAAGNPPA